MSTNDGDDYFSLRLSFGSFQIHVCDSNINLDQAHPKRSRELEDLPTREDMEHELARFPDSDVGQRILDEISALRKDLVNRGAEVAATMSDSELMATAVRVRWKQKQHVAAGDDWVADLAGKLSERGSDAGTTRSPDRQE